MKDKQVCRTCRDVKECLLNGEKGKNVLIYCTNGKRFEVKGK